MTHSLPATQQVGPVKFIPPHWWYSPAQVLWACVMGVRRRVNVRRRVSWGSMAIVEGGKGRLMGIGRGMG
jgi:hypothetical protein